MKLRIPSLLCATLLGILPWPVLAEPGSLVEVTSTTSMQMPNGTSMPPQTHTNRACTSATKPDPSRMVPSGKGCSVSDYRRSGDLVTYHMSCTGELSMQGDARIELNPDGGFHGVMHVTTEVEGRKMVVDTAYDGKRIGKCDYVPR